MRKSLLLNIIIFTLAITVHSSFAQTTTALDFNRADCNGNMHHLFTNDLDSGNVVIIEFFMGGLCTPCITTGQNLETMKSGLSAVHPGKIRSYLWNFDDIYPCSSIIAWATFNGITATPMDSGTIQTAWYGGMAMPTVVVLAGTSHSVIYTNIDAVFFDTTTVKDRINSFFAGNLNVGGDLPEIALFNVFPNPANDLLNFSMKIKETGKLNIQVTDIAGKTISTVSDEIVPEGDFSATANISGLSDGFYVVKVTINGMTTFSKFTVAR